MTTVITLLSRARMAGLRLADEEGVLRVRGPRTQEALVGELLARKKDVLGAVHVYNRTASRLDWRRGQILDEPVPCVLCGRRTILLDLWDRKPCHKSCAEAAIAGARPIRKEGRSA
jgi:hypothetical protein